MKTHLDIPYVANATDMQKLDVYLPGKENFDTLIWFHGGGLENGSRKSNAAYPELVVGQGHAFVSVEYRMYPDAKFPEFLEDAAASVAWVLENIPALGGTGKVFVSGESAGAYITMMLCLDQHYLKDAGVDQNKIAGFISDSAQQCNHFNVMRELGMNPQLERIDNHAPMYFVEEGLKIRPLLLMYYSNDMKCRPEETKLMYASLKKVMPDAWVELAQLPGNHCCQPKAEDGSNMMLNRTFEFMDSVCGRIKKVLAIGNSFSQDATKYLKLIADSGNMKVKVVNLYIGGCSLETHAYNLARNLAYYSYELNSAPAKRMVSIPEALMEEKWDVVTIQQASHFSGKPETYEPYGTQLLDCIQKLAPQAKVYFHMTWAYEHDSTHGAFPDYHCSQAEMINRIQSTVKDFTAAHQLPVIPAGTLIQNLRQTPEFDYLNGGESLCRDGFHMSWTYGRYAVGAAWYEVLFGGNILETTFAPDETEPEKIALIKEQTHALCS